jgi:hypothetical protein
MGERGRRKIVRNRGGVQGGSKGGARGREKERTSSFERSRGRESRLVTIRAMYLRFNE